MSEGEQLGVVEQLTWMVSQVGSMNFAFIVELATPFEEARFHGAVAALRRRHPRLVARIEPSPPRFVRDDVPEIPCRVVESGPRGWVEVAEREVDGGFDTRVGPLVRVAAVLGPAPDTFTVILTFHHAAGDAASSALLAADFVTAWFGGDPGPSVTTTLRPVEERLLPRPMLRRAWSVLSAARTGMRVARSDRLLLPEAAPSRPGERRQRIHPRTLDAETVTRLLERCRERGVRLTGLLAAALMIAVYREAAPEGPRNLTCVVPVNLRPDMDPAAAGEVGMFVSFTLTCARVAPPSDPWEIARDVHAQITGARARGEPLGLLWLQRLVIRRVRTPEELYESARNDAEQSTGLTNLGVVAHPALVDDPRVTGVGFTAANHPTGTLFGAAVVGFRGGLQLNFSHAEPCVRADRGEAIADAVTALLRTV